MAAPDALREHALEIALRELGNGESEGNNRGEDVDRFRRVGGVGGVGGNGAWCAAFVSYCYRLAAAELHIALPFETSSGAKRLVKNIVRGGGKAIQPLPWNMAAARGAVICWHRGLGPLDWRGHVGIVQAYNGATDTLDVIEGNHGALVARYPYTGEQWRKRLYLVAMV